MFLDTKITKQDYEVHIKHQFGRPINPNICNCALEQEGSFTKKVKINKEGICSFNDNKKADYLIIDCSGNQKEKIIISELKNKPFQINLSPWFGEFGERKFKLEDNNLIELTKREKGIRKRYFEKIL